MKKVFTSHDRLASSKVEAILQLITWFTQCTSELLGRSSVVLFVHSIAKLKSQLLSLGWTSAPKDPEEDS